MEFLIGFVVLVPVVIAAVNSQYTEAPWLLFSTLISLVFGVFVGWITSLLVPLYVPLFTGLLAYIWLLYRLNGQFRAAIQRTIKSS
tara:strand:+ start:645 stop:902 length:258 start_codon:yes stop_codon:yes gene_type:complete